MWAFDRQNIKKCECNWGTNPMTWIAESWGNNIGGEREELDSGS